MSFLKSVIWPDFIEMSCATVFAFFAEVFKQLKSIDDESILMSYFKCLFAVSVVCM